MKYRRLSMRFQLLLMYLLVVGTVCLSYMPMSGRVRSQLQDNYRRQIELRFEQSMSMLEDSARQVYHIHDTMSAYSDYREVLMLKGSQGLREGLAKFIITSYLLNHYISTIPLVDKAFVMFSRSGGVVDEAQLYLSYQEFADFGMAVTDLCMEDRLALLHGEKQHHQLSFVSLRRSTPRPALLIFIDRPYTSVRVGMVYYQETLLKLFQMDSLPPGSGFTLRNQEGEVVYQYGEARGDSFRYGGSAFIAGLDVTLYVPQDYYDSLLSGFDHMLANTLAVAVGVGILLSAVLTLINYLPVKRLLHLSGKKTSLSQGNEYALLYEHIQDSDSQIAYLHTDVVRLRANLRSSLFARLLNGSVHTASELELSWKLLPQLKERNFLALVKLSSPRDDVPITPFFGFLQPLEQENAYLQQMDYGQMALLLPAREETVEELRELLDREQASLNQMGMALYAGVSEEFTGAEGLYIAHHQAQMALANQQLMARFTSEGEKDARPSLNFLFLQRLYELLVAGEGDAAEDMILDMGQDMRLHPVTRDQQIEAASLVRFTFDSVMADLRLPELPRPLSSIHVLTRQDLREMLDSLVKDAQTLAGAVAEMRRRAGSKSRDKVMRYIRENFSSPAIYAESIAQACDVSPNTVYQIARESTGRSLGDYIESLRLEMACRLLETTDYPVMDISARCGWAVPATFYRVFKQNLGVSPGQYRKQRGEV